MKYVSTRGVAPELSFKDALLTGLASDGGLYLPDVWPSLSAEQIQDLQGRPYTEVALAIMEPFVNGEIPRDALKSMIEEAYATFHHPVVAPMVQTGENHWLLELFHGPTLAFKDVAMQILSRLMDHVLQERGQRITIVGATSGDTGGAAMAAFQACDGIDTFFMFPAGRVSEFQRRQMTTLGADNCHAIQVDGTFDDCQNLVKAMFADTGFRDRVQLAAVNSINWGRIMAQVVYYFTSAVALGAPARSVSFTVPTGNFGDIYAGYVAKKMGLPIDRLVIATNENDILARTLQTGTHDLRAVTSTITPSMDIQISSNFERLLFEASGRDAATVTELMMRLKEDGRYHLPEKLRDQITAEFWVGRASQTETLDEIARVKEECGYLMDPHTAVGAFVARAHASAQSPMVTLSTAHPAKFPDAIQAAINELPPVPAFGEQDQQTPEAVTKLPNDLAAVEAFVVSKSRASDA